MPAAMYSSMRRATWFRSSSSSSCATRAGWKRERRRRRSTAIQRMGPPWLRRLHHQGDRRGQALPLGGLLLQGAASGPGERVVLGPPIVLALTPLGLDPAVLLELVQGRIERALAHPQLVLRHLA